jgi:hypothetical protein
MNRRDFIKTTGVIAAAGPLTTSLSEGRQTGTTLPPLSWDYRVYCYEREQGEWVFSQNIRGSFAHQREYMTFEEDEGCPYAGWMDHGKLHFVTLEEATDFVDMHVRTKDDANIIDSIYDIYYINRYDEGEGGVEIQVAHYWFNGNTGRQIQWINQEGPPYTDYTKIEAS